MPSLFLHSFNDHSTNLRGRIIGIYAVLIAVNLAAWAWALIAFHDYPVLLGTAFLAYGFGMRHAVDADHIAAIDNVTRKLMQEGKRPVAAGLYFSLGHSTIVFALAALFAFMLRENMSNFVPGFAMTPGIALIGIAMILALGVITGIIPALNAMRLKIAAALGRG